MFWFVLIIYMLGGFLVMCGAKKQGVEWVAFIILALGVYLIFSGDDIKQWIRRWRSK